MIASWCVMCLQWFLCYGLLGVFVCFDWSLFMMLVLIVVIYIKVVCLDIIRTYGYGNVWFCYRICWNLYCLLMLLGVLFVVLVLYLLCVFLILSLIGLFVMGFILLLIRGWIVCYTATYCGLFYGSYLWWWFSFDLLLHVRFVLGVIAGTGCCFHYCWFHFWVNDLP